MAVCSCLPSFIGRSPNCRPECTVNSDCPSNLGCMNQKCVNPCIGSCGLNANCMVSSHIPICTCFDGYTGDPFVQCQQHQCKKTLHGVIRNLLNDKIFPVTYLPPDETACTRNPCGVNAVCKELNNAGSCTCIPNYYGDPYISCRPECVMNSECPSDKACINTKCRDPCPGVCGSNALCSVINHSPSCHCLEGFRGNAFESCSRVPVYAEPIPDPCQPSPCGPYSQCRKVNNVAICACVATYIGSPPNCRPECSVSADCPFDKSCINQKCKDPCPGMCGINARCQVVNHNPICTCIENYNGDPFVRCARSKKSLSIVCSQFLQFFFCQMI